ncbi:hypothetical protein [Saccharothrix australiensis]|nr:hypothetical protein [Saccharothrix australiensis]
MCRGKGEAGGGGPGVDVGDEGQSAVAVLVAQCRAQALVDYPVVAARQV